MKTAEKIIQKIIPAKNDKRPIAKFYRTWLEDELRDICQSNRRGINEQQYRAANRLASSYERSLSNGGWDPTEVSLKREYFRYHKTEIQVQHFREFNKAFGQLGTKSQAIIQHFCLDELGIRLYELKQIPKWPKGAGSARLREALDELAEIYKKHTNVILRLDRGIHGIKRRWIIRSSRIMTEGKSGFKTSMKKTVSSEELLV